MYKRQELKVDVVLECSGFYTSKDKAQAHINAGARKVVISAPAGNDLPTIVYNTNHETLKAEDTIISAASCTTDVYKRQVHWKFRKYVRYVTSRRKFYRKMM